MAYMKKTLAAMIWCIALIALVASPFHADAQGLYRR